MRSFLPADTTLLPSWWKKKKEKEREKWTGAYVWQLPWGRRTKLIWFETSPRKSRDIFLRKRSISSSIVVMLEADETKNIIFLLNGVQFLSKLFTVWAVGAQTLKKNVFGLIVRKLIVPRLIVPRLIVPRLIVPGLIVPRLIIERVPFSFSWFLSLLWLLYFIYV
jgi:hypothetical protein